MAGRYTPARDLDMELALVGGLLPEVYCDALSRLARMHSTTVIEELKWAVYIWATTKGVEISE